MIVRLMNCWHCQTKLRWVGDHDVDDITDNRYSILSCLECPECKRGLKSTIQWKVMMIQIKITPDILSRAKKKAATVGNLQGSITGSLSNVVGAIGEIVVEDYAGGEPVNSKDFDLLIKNRRVDVKTKRCNTTPSPNYDCSVAAHGSKQDCDSYVFVRILTDHSKAWILGEVTKENFYKKK